MNERLLIQRLTVANRALDNAATPAERSRLRQEIRALQITLEEKFRRGAA